MRRVPGNREARSRAATIKLTYRVGLPKRHDFGLRLCQWVDEGMLLRSPTLAEVSQWLLGRFERRWSQIPWCPDATRWSHPPGSGSGNPPSLLSGIWARSPSVWPYLPPAASSLRMPPSQPRVSPRSHVSACSRNDIHRQVSRTMDEPSTANPCSTMIASVHPCRDTASNSSARRRMAGGGLTTREFHHSLRMYIVSGGVSGGLFRQLLE